MLEAPRLVGCEGGDAPLALGRGAATRLRPTQVEDGGGRPWPVGLAEVQRGRYLAARAGRRARLGQVGAVLACDLGGEGHRAPIRIDDLHNLGALGRIEEL